MSGYHYAGDLANEFMDALEGAPKGDIRGAMALLIDKQDDPRRVEVYSALQDLVLRRRSLMKRTATGYFAGHRHARWLFWRCLARKRRGRRGRRRPLPGHAPDQVVFYELTRKFVETRKRSPGQVCDVLYYTLAVGHHTGVLDCFEPRLSVHGSCSIRSSTRCRRGRQGPSR